MSLFAIAISISSGLFISIFGGLVLFIIQQSAQDRRKEADDKEKRIQGLERAVSILREAIIAIRPDMLEWLRSHGDRD